MLFIHVCVSVWRIPCSLTRGPGNGDALTIMGMMVIVGYDLSWRSIVACWRVCRADEKAWRDAVISRSERTGIHLDFGYRLALRRKRNHAAG